MVPLFAINGMVIANIIKVKVLRKNSSGDNLLIYMFFCLS